MERDEIANPNLWPADQLVGSLVWAAEQAGVFQKFSELVYGGLQQALRWQFHTMNELEIEGAENVPPHGGVILACNHQSWLDVQVLGASSPRRVHFIAKSEFETWPVLRHLVKLSESVFVRRGGDDAVLESVAEALRNGWAVAIFPEGTIPG